MSKLFGIKSYIAPLLICFLFFFGYVVLSFVRHDNYQSFGYDLGINDQVVWRYAHFQNPITTIDPYPNQTKFAEHVEIVYALISPAYWIWDSRKMLLLLEPLFFCSSGLAVYLLAKKKRINFWVRLAFIIGYLGFYGVQNAIWSDVHSASFAASFVMWFVYFLEEKKKWFSILFFFLAITAKENIGLLTFLIAGVYWVKNKKAKLPYFFMSVSVIYVAFIFYIFFPYIMHVKYLYQNNGGIFSNLFHLQSFVDTTEKRQVIFYSLLSFGFLPLLSPLYLIPIIGDLFTYFVIASQLPGAQGFFGQYRITLSPLLIWASIISVGRYKWLNKWYIAVYLLLFTAFAQYSLHLPFSYLTKQSFWYQPPTVSDINYIRTNYIKPSDSLVAQNNIVSHLSHRDKIYSLYPEKRNFNKNSPCGQTSCDWFRWYDSPEYLFVDTSSDWDIRHLLTDRVNFISGLKNLEKAKVITKYKEVGYAILYKVNENPDNYK
ncbi:MAG TPA: DUF2079 domain-containing protein [Patescibacteria group bacterium]